MILWPCDFAFLLNSFAFTNFAQNSSLIHSIRLQVGERVAAAAGQNKKILVMAKTQIPATHMP